MGKSTKLVNYDVKRLGYRYVSQFIPATVREPDGSEHTFYVPAKDLEGKSEDQINANILHTYKVLQYAWNLINAKKLKNPIMLENVVNCISEVACIYIKYSDKFRVSYD